MADEFDSLVSGGGMSSGLLQLANLFNATSQQNNALSASLFDRSIQSQNQMQALSAMDRQMTLQDRQFQQQSRRAAMEQSYQREQSAFERLNQSLNFQLKIAEKERVERDQAFARTLQAMQIDMQAQVQGLQLEAMQNQRNAQQNSGKVTALLNDMEASVNDADFGTLQKQYNQAAEYMKSSWFYAADPQIKQGLTMAHQAAGQTVLKVKKLADLESLVQEVTVDSLFPELDNALARKNVSAADLQILSYFKGLLGDALSDGELEDDEIRAVQPQIAELFGAEKAQQINDRFFNGEARDTLVARLSYAPNKPLDGDALFRYVGATQGLNNLERTILSNTTMPENQKSAFLDGIREERLQAYFRAAGSDVPAYDSAASQTSTTDHLKQEIYRYAFSDFNLDDNTVPFSQRVYYRQVAPEATGTRAKNIPPPVKVNLYDESGNISKEFIAALEAGELREAPREATRVPGGPKGYGLFTSNMRKVDPIPAYQMKKFLSDMRQSQNEFVKTLNPTRMGTAMIRQTPDQIVATMDQRLGTLMDSLDIQYRGGQAGLRSGGLTLRNFLPRSYLHRSDLIVAALAKNNILQGTPGFANNFVNYAQNLNTMQLYSILANDPMNLQTTLGGMMRQANQIGSGQTPQTQAGSMQPTQQGSSFSDLE